MVTVDSLRMAYYEVANNGPVDEYVTALQQSNQLKYSQSLNKIQSMFNGTIMSLWTRTDTRNGHVKYRHAITQVTVEFSARLNPLDPGAAYELYEKLQQHINILGNEIFKFTTHNWKIVPDFNRALANYTQWRASQGA